jgi:hypothetical protein
MKPKSSRFEVNKEVRHIFARHSVDTTLVTFQTHGFEVSVGGILWHNDDSDFNAHQLEALIQDFQLTLPTYTLRGETENWSFSSSSMRRVTDVMEVTTDNAGNVVEGASTETIIVGEVSSDED